MPSALLREVWIEVFEVAAGIKRVRAIAVDRKLTTGRASNHIADIAGQTVNCVDGKCVTIGIGVETESERVADGAEQVADRLLLAQGADESRWAAWQFILPLLVLALLMEGGFANRRLDVRRDGS